MKRREKVILENDRIEYREIDLKKRMNLYYLNLTNKTKLIGKYNLPALQCKTNVLPDYLALYTQPNDYHKTENTGVCFFLYDDTFDQLNGLYNAIYYNDQKRLQYFKNRFKGVKFFISPDYSLFGDVDEIENKYRIKKARIVSLWLTEELHAIVIPLITYPTYESLDFVLDGLEECEVVAFSTKGYITNNKEYNYLKDAIEYTVNHLNLKSIVVYDCCGTNYKVYDLFESAIRKNIKIIIPNNSLKIQNSKRKESFSDAR